MLVHGTIAFLFAAQVVGCGQEVDTGQNDRESKKPTEETTSPKKNGAAMSAEPTRSRALLTARERRTALAEKNVWALIELETSTGSCADGLSSRKWTV